MSVLTNLLFFLILFFHHQNKDSGTLLSYCLRTGTTDPTLWPQVITALSTASDNDESIRILLNHLKHSENLKLHPLTLLRLLDQRQSISGSKSISLGSVKVYHKNIKNNQNT